MTARYLLPLVLLATLGFTRLSAQSTRQPHKHGDWFVGIGAGFSQSLAENAKSTDFIAHQLPSVDVLIGHNFTPAFGFQLTGGMNMQVSRCSEAAENVMPDVYGNGRYSFKCLTGSLSGVLNLTNVFFGYEVERPLTWSLVFGGGVVKTFGFDEKLSGWNEYPYYPVDANGGLYGVGHLGLQWAIRVSEPLDINVDFRANATDNKYNGVSNGNHVDFYFDLMCNLVYHFKNGKQGLRRFRTPPIEPYVDPYLRNPERGVVETVRFGEQMNTTIPFYAGFAFLNATTMQRVEAIAAFLRVHPEVNLNIIGYPDIIPDEDLEFHKTLATKRAEIVRTTLIDTYHVEPTRLRSSYADRSLQSFKEVREWVPAVTFEMEPRTE